MVYDNNKERKYVSYFDRFPWHMRNPYRRWTKDWLSYSLYRVFVGIPKHWFQWAVRGHADNEWWQLSTCWVELLLPRLKQFRHADRSGIRSDFYGQECELIGKTPFDDLTKDEFKRVSKAATARWDAILDEIIEGMELYLEDDWLMAPRDFPWEKEEDRAKSRKVSRAFDLWMEHFPAMWD